LGCWLVVLTTPKLALTCLLFGALLFPVRRDSLRWRRARLVAVVLLLGATAVFWQVLATELGDRLEQLAQAKDRNGETAFSTRDLLGVYGLNLVMGAGGYLVGYPEVADETLALAWPGAPVRRWDSDFAMGSPKVRAAVREMVRGLPASGASQAILPSQSVDWPTYGFETDSMRVALAVNCPFLIEGRGHRDDGGAWILDLSGTARIAYPRRAFIPLGVRRNGKPWGLDEGLFWVLEERGWLHPYTAVWSWSVSAHDPRLEDTTHVDRSWRERAFQRAWDVVR
jgi:hypothetical protein